MARADDPIAAHMLKYAILALDLDLALARMQEASAVSAVDLAALDKVTQLLDFAREGQKLFKQPRLTLNAVAAMSVYETLERSGSVIPEGDRQEVLQVVERLVKIVKSARPGEGFPDGGTEAAKLLRLFFSVFRNEALSVTSRPIETVSFLESQIAVG